MSNVVDLKQYREKNDPNFVKIGDIVEWEDFDGELYQSKVVDIRNVSGTYSVESISLQYKQHFAVFFEDGMTVYGSIVKRKIPRRKAV